MSKNLTLSENYSKNAFTHQFTTLPGSILVGNNQPVGSPTIDQTRKGVHYPNVQAAIDDMPALFTLGINSVIINTDGINPAGNSQVNDFKFSGTIQYPGKIVGDDVIFDFYGFRATVKVGDTGEEVAAKIKPILEIAVADNHVIDKVNFGATLDILQLRYNDFQTHILPQYTLYGVKVSPTISSPAKPGYGIWSRIGTTTVKLDGATENTTFYYFRRDN